MKVVNRFLHYLVIFCLAIGSVALLSPIAPTAVQADGPLPPAEETMQTEEDTETPGDSLTDEEREVRAALDALETARRQGPEAVVALLDILRGPGLDAVNEDIRAAQEMLALSAPGLPETDPVSLAEEEAALEAQMELDIVDRLREYPGPAGMDAPEFEAPEIPAEMVPSSVSADLTVGSPPCDYATVAAAVTAANAGDRLLLEGGVTFAANLSIQENLTIQGGYAGCGSGSSSRTTLNGGNAGRVMYIYGGLVIVLENLNITNGNTTGNGAGIFVGANTQLTGTNIHIYNNTSSGLGGGLRLFGGSATLTDSAIRDNIATAGAGVHGELSTYAPSLNLSSYSDIYDNQALAGSGQGGGVYMSEGTVSISDCSDIYSNDAVQGGGAYLTASTLTIGGDCSEIQSNTATENGGGIYALNSTVNLDNLAELVSNQAGYGGGTGSGGGAFLDNSGLYSDKASITYNTAHNYGGGVYATNGSILDMDLGGYTCTGPRCSALSHNTATTAYGGGVYASVTSEVDLRQIFLEGNTATLGGAIYASASPIYLYNALVARNDATSGTGDGLRLVSSSSVTGEHNTVANNNASGSTTGSAIALSTSTLTLSNSIVWGHSTNISLADQTVTCSDIQGGYTGTGNMDVDPLFVDPATSNFHLQSLSPVVDRCSSGQAADFDNEARPVTYVRPATPYDMGADEASTRVGINGAACAYGRIQDAVDAAPAGATIQVEADEFVEYLDINGKTLTIRGGYDSNCTNHLGSTTTVNGDNLHTVFTIAESTVTLRDLQITGGEGTTGGGVKVLPGSSQVTLDNTDVFGNHAEYGGGLYVDAGNVLTLTNDSDVHDNTATYFGGGARIWGRLEGSDWSSVITNNSAPNGGGVSLPGGVLEFTGSHITNNHATDAAGLGGGIHAYNGGIVSVTSSSNISNNTAYDGGGIYADHSSLTLTAIVHSNTAAHHGGGIYLANSSSLTANNTYLGYAASSWGENTAINGAGLYADSSTVDFDGYILNNIASARGGGIYAINSILSLTDTHLGGTGSYQANQLGPSGHEGAGLYLIDGTRATLDNTHIASNAFQTTGYTYGGGAYITSNSVMTATNSIIERHSAPSPTDGRGAGLYLNGSTVTLDNTQVLTNTAGTTGGGIRMLGTSTVNIINGSELRGNQATTGPGGALAAGDTPDINISDAALLANTAGTDGGAVYLNNGSLDFNIWWDLNENTAGGNGGAVAVVGTGSASFRASAGSSSISDNHAGGAGGALYLNNDTTLKLYANAGYPLTISGNNANGNGGFGAANSGGLFDTYGMISFVNNFSTSGNGGVFYLSNNARVWFDDYVTNLIEILGNHALNGGAIYAENSPRVECDGVQFGSSSSGNYTTSGAGGAIYLNASTFDADNCVFSENQSKTDGGAIAAYDSELTIHANFPLSTLSAEYHSAQAPSGLLAIQSTACDPRTHICSGFLNNTADSDRNASGSGGAIYASGSTLNVSHTYLQGNAAARGGAIYQIGSDAVGQVSNVLITDNTVTEPYGAGIRVNSGVFTVTHTTIAYNYGGVGYSGIASAVYNSIAWGNPSGGFTSIPTIASCNIDSDGKAGSAIDPQFVSPGEGENYHLQYGSPAVDACATGDPLDLNNISRPYGSAYDMGPFELYLAKLYLPLSVNGAGH